MNMSWLNEIILARQGLAIASRFSVEGILINLWASDHSLVKWVLTYLDPLSTISDSPVGTTYTIGCLYSDEIVLDALRAAHLDPDVLQQQGYGRAPLTKHFAGDSSIVYTDSEEGVIWLVDLRDHSLTVIFSSRTKWPALEFARSVREVITRYLESMGWVQYHAGCVMTSQGGILFIGDKGAGKTTLLLALMDAGVSYVANERTFVKEDDGAIRAIGYPIAVAVGLGTLMQFGQLRSFVRDHDLLLYPRRRRDRERILRTDPDGWPLLKDKIEFLPNELIDAINGEPAVRTAHLQGIVAPRVSLEPVEPSIQPLEPDQARQLLTFSALRRVSDRSYAAWLDVGFRESDNNVEAVARLTSIHLRYHVSASHPEANRLLLAHLLNAVN